MLSTLHSQKYASFTDFSIAGNTLNSGGYGEYPTCQDDQQQQRNHQKKLSEASRSYSTGKLSKFDGISFCFRIDSSGTKYCVSSLKLKCISFPH